MKKYYKFILYIILYFILTIITNEILSEFFDGGLTLFLSSLITSLVFIFIFIKDFKKDFQNFKKDYFKDIFLYWLCGYIFVIVTNNFLYSIFNTISENEELNRTALSDFGLTAILTMAIIGPITEELIFRLGIRKSFSNKYLYIGISAFLFGYLHVIGNDIIFIIPYAGLGAAFAYAHYKTNNIYVPIIMHIFHNSLTLTLLFSMGAV